MRPGLSTLLVFSGIVNNDVYGEWRRGDGTVDGRGKSRQARGESGGNARRSENIRHLSSPSSLGPTGHNDPW